MMDWLIQMKATKRTSDNSAIHTMTDCPKRLLASLLRIRRKNTNPRIPQTTNRKYDSLSREPRMNRLGSSRYAPKATMRMMPTIPVTFSTLSSRAPASFKVEAETNP